MVKLPIISGGGGHTMWYANTKRHMDSRRRHIPKISEPIITHHNDVKVVRDDLVQGGTKARFLPALFKYTDELVYATPAEGGAQTALAHTAKALGKKATLFVARRKNMHARTKQAIYLGAKVIEVNPGYLNVVQARAREYCQETGSLLAPFGLNFPEAINKIADTALLLGEYPDEVWCAGGSGVLARGLAKAWPNAQLNVVEVGKALDIQDISNIAVYKTNISFSRPAQVLPPFPSCPHYDAKAWAKCLGYKGVGNVLFWNVTGPANND